MSDLIDRQDVIDVLGKWFKDVFGIKESDGTATIFKKIRNLPSVQPERKKGKWIRENIVLTSNPPQYMWHCSECGKMVHWFTTEVLTDYCPNCGADMRSK